MNGWVGSWVLQQAGKLWLLPLACTLQMPTDPPALAAWTFWPSAEGRAACSARVRQPLFKRATCHIAKEVGHPAHLLLQPVAGAWLAPGGPRHNRYCCF